MPQSLSTRVVVDGLGEHTWTLYEVKDTAVDLHTELQRAAIHTHASFGKMLFLDGELQSASCDEFIYHETIVHPAMLVHPRPRRVAILGGGDGGTAREVLRYGEVEVAVMIDIDPKVIELSRRYLPELSRGSFSDSRLQTVIADARVWMEQTEEKFDVIISDLTEPITSSLSEGLFSAEFFSLLKARLREPGVLSVQASHGNLGMLDHHCAIRRNLESAFPICRTMLCHIPSFGCHWAFATASATLDPMGLDPAAVDDRLRERGLSGLRYYDGTTHRRLLALPRYVRQALGEQREAP